MAVALKKAKVPDTDLNRKSVCRMIRKLMSKADAEAEAKAEAEREVAAADMQAKRKDLKAREAALKLALREARPKWRSAFSGGGGGSASSSSSSGSGGGGSSGGGAEAEAAQDAAVAVKAKLTVARGKLRELNAKRGPREAAGPRHVGKAQGRARGGAAGGRARARGRRAEGGRGQRPGGRITI